MFDKFFWKSLFNKSGIAKKLLTAILLFSGGITLTLSGVELYRELNVRMSDLQVSLEKIKQNQLGPLLHASWVMDLTQQQSVIKSLGSIPSVAYCALYDHNNKLVVSAGKLDNYGDRPEIIPLMYNDDTRSTLVGYFHLQGNVTAVRSRVKNHMVSILIGQFIKTSLTSLFILFIAHYFINQHLFAVSSYIRRRLPNRNDKLLLKLRRTSGTKNPDELDGLVGAINKFKSDLDHHHGEIMRYQSEQTALSEHLLSIFGGMNEAVMTLDGNSEILYCNNAGHELLSIPEKERWLGHNIDEFITIYQTQFSSNPLNIGDLLRDSQANTLVLNCYYINGDERHPAELTIVPAHPTTNTKRYYAYLIMLRDTNEVALLKEATYHANHDYLTGLNNRFSFDKVVQELAVNPQEQAYSLCVIDLDRFKQINDTCGHDVGDQALIIVAHCMKQNFGNMAVSARLGGDEFSAVIPADPQEAHKRCKLFLADLAMEGKNQQELNEHNLALTASIGVTDIDENGIVKSVFIRADRACYNVKKAGRSDVNTVLSTEYTVDDASKALN